MASIDKLIYVSGYLIILMGKLSLKLERKVKHIQYYYSKGDAELDAESIAEKDKGLFESMQRWHVNAHVLDDEWSNIFHSIKSNLKTPAKFREDMDWPIGLKKFVNAKMACKSLKTQFIISDIFPDKLEHEILQYYHELLDNEKECLDQGDEFSEDGILGIVKLSQADISFFQKVFQPNAIFATYRGKHSDLMDTKQLMEECFSLGAGCKRMDLMPEVNAYCEICCGTEWCSFYEKLNKIIFNRQMSNKFNLPFTDGGDTSDSDGELKVEQRNQEKGVVDSVDKLQKDENKVVVAEIENPFLSDTSSEASIDQGEMTNFPFRDFCCCICKKRFSREIFVKMHKDLFHKNFKEVIPVDGRNLESTHSNTNDVQVKRKIIPEFVSDDVDLISSFVICGDGGPSMGDGKSDFSVRFSEKSQAIGVNSRVVTEFVNDDVDLMTSFSEIEAGRQPIRNGTREAVGRKSKVRKSLQF